MVKLLNVSLIILMLGWSGLTALAQDPAPKTDEDDSSEQVEQREDSYRRQMELEDARSRDRTYVDSTYTPTVKQEKIDKLPVESRDNIRDQLVDIIMENGEWEPSDALKEYPYQPTAAAEDDADLKAQEQEAWDEQVEKYNEREAAAFGSYRGPVPGPGNPDGQQGGQQGENAQGQEGGGQGEGQGSQGTGGGEAEKKSGAAGAYQPYQAGSSRSEDEVSTAGVSESALDFLRGGSAPSQQAQAENNPTESAAEYLAEEATPESEQQASAQTDNQPAQQNPDQPTSEQQQDSSEDVPIDLRGVIAIEDLDKLEGTEILIEPAEPDNP